MPANLIIAVNSFSDLQYSPTKDPSEILQGKNQNQRTWQIVKATVAAVAAAVFFALATLAFISFAIFPGTMIALPAFLPLAIGTLSTLTALALSTLVIKTSISAEQKRSPHVAKEKITLPTVEFSTPDEESSAVEFNIIQNMPSKEITYGIWHIKKERVLANNSIQFNINENDKVVNGVRAKDTHFRLDGNSIYEVSYGIMAQPEITKLQAAGRKTGKTFGVNLKPFTFSLLLSTGVENKWTSISKIEISETMEVASKTMEFASEKFTTGNYTPSLCLYNSSDYDMNIGNPSEPEAYGAYIKIQKIL